jgi:hypothetical protein
MINRHDKMECKRIGTLEICYLEEKPASDEGPFLKEAKNLIGNTAGLWSK